MADRPTDLGYIGVSPTAAADVIALLTDDDGDIALDGVLSSVTCTHNHIIVTILANWILVRINF